MLPVDPHHPDPAAIRRAAEILRAGGLVAFPTETVYGLGGNALDAEAVARIYSAKGRPAFNPLIAHLASAAAARELAAEWTSTADRLSEAFWPGPLTLVVKRAAVVPESITGGLGTVGLRVPAHPVARALLEAAGIPVAAPSANRYMAVSPTTAAHVVTGLSDRVDLVLDGGATPVGIESAVVDATGERALLLRPGTLGAAEISSIVGPLGAPSEYQGDAPRPSPGMVGRHYAPRARVARFASGDRTHAAALVEEAGRRGESVGGLFLHEPIPGVEHAVRMPADAAGYARRLYAELHRLDGFGCGLILVEELPSDPEWAGVRDRLGRAAAEG